MIEWLNEGIMSLIRKLEYDQFMSKEMRVRLEDELSKLLKMRENYREHQEAEKKEKQNLLHFKW